MTPFDDINLNRAEVRIGKLINLKSPSLRANLNAILRALIDDSKASERARRACDDGLRGYVKVPFMAKSADAAPLQAVVAYAAHGGAVTPYLAAYILTLGWEAIADQIGYALAPMISS